MKISNSLRLRHILDAIAKIERYLENFDEANFRSDERTQDAIIRQLEIIGEASTNLTTELRDKNPQIPWEKLTAVRNRIAHGYFTINLEIVWDITQNDLSRLQTEVEQMLEKLS